MAYFQGLKCDSVDCGRTFQTESCEVRTDLIKRLKEEGWSYNYTDKRARCPKCKGKHIRG